MHACISDILTCAKRLLHFDGTERCIGQRRKTSQTKLVKGNPQERSHGECTPETHTKIRTMHAELDLCTGTVLRVATERVTSTFEHPTHSNHCHGSERVFFCHFLYGTQ